MNVFMKVSFLAWISVLSLFSGFAQATTYYTCRLERSKVIGGLEQFVFANDKSVAAVREFYMVGKKMGGASYDLEVTEFKAAQNEFFISGFMQSREARKVNLHVVKNSEGVFAGTLEVIGDEEPHVLKTACEPSTFFDHHVNDSRVVRSTKVPLGGLKCKDDENGRGNIYFFSHKTQELRSEPIVMPSGDIFAGEHVMKRYSNNGNNIEVLALGNKGNFDSDILFTIKRASDNDRWKFEWKIWRTTTVGGSGTCESY